MAVSPDRAALLDNLAAAVQHDGCPVRPLDEDRYVDAHQAFERASTQQSQIRRLIEEEARRLRQNGHAELDMLSVGCGCGLLDAPLLAHLSGSVNSFVGVDPNAVALNRCEQALGALPTRPSYRLACTRFEDFRPDRRFDLIYCSHVFYYVADRAGVLDAMRALLRDHGTLVIVHAPKADLNALAEVFWPDRGPEAFYAPDLQQLIKSRGASARVRSIEARIPRSLFADATPQGMLLLEFLIQAQWAPLSPDVKAHVAEYLDWSVLPGTQEALPHPATLFTLRPDA